MSSWLQYVEKETGKAAQVLGPLIREGRAVMVELLDDAGNVIDRMTLAYDDFVKRFEPTLPKPSNAAIKATKPEETDSGTGAPELPPRETKFSGPVPVTIADDQVEALKGFFSNCFENLRSDLAKYFGPVSKPNGPTPPPSPPETPPAA